MVDRRAKYRSRKRRLLAERERSRRDDKVAVENALWTDADFFLNRADGDDFDSIDRVYVSYGPDDDGEVCFKSVGPEFGPLRISGPAAIDAFECCIERAYGIDVE